MTLPRGISIALGLVLLAAGLLKYLGLTEGAINPSLIGRDWWVLLAGFTAEVVLGAWLLSGLFPRLARWLTMACFFTFGAVSAYKAVLGEASCGCLGPLRIDPWVMFAFDLVALSALAAFPPTPAAKKVKAWDFVTLAGIVVLGLGLGASAYESVTRISRRLLVSETRHEFGVVAQGQHLTHVFEIENRCGYPVEIAESRSTCYCTKVADVNGRVIAPGEKCEIAITLATDDAEEHIAGGVRLFCRRAGSSAAPVFFQRLNVSAKVDPDFWCRPRVVSLGRVRGGEVVKGTTRIRPNRMPDVRVLGFSSPHPAVSAAAKERTPAGDEIIEVVFDGSKASRSESLEVPIIVRTSSPNRPEVIVLVCATYEASVEATPSAIVVGADLRGEVVREVSVEAISAVEIENAKVTGGMTVSAEKTSQDSKSWRLVVRIPDPESGASNGELRFLVTGSGRAREVVIPIHRFSARP